MSYGSIQGQVRQAYTPLNEVDPEEADYLSKIGKESPEDKSNFLSKLLFWWCNFLVMIGYKRPLEHLDLPAVSKRDDAKPLSEKFEMYWAEELKSNKPSLVRALRRSFGFEFLMAAIPKLLGDSLGFIGPLAMQQIIKWLDNPEGGMWVGYTCAAVLLIAPLLQTITQNHYFYITFRTGMNVRAAVIATVYRKALRLSPTSRQKRTVGEIVNLQSNDTQRLMDLCPNFHLVWSAPVQIIAALILLVITIGPSAFVGLAVMIILIPIQGIIAARLGTLRKGLLTKTDKRIKLMNEILQGIRIIKYYAWEEKFSTAIDEIRKEEVTILMSQAYWRAYIGFFLISSPIFVSMATFGVYSLSGETLTPEIIFPALAYFNLLRFPLTFMPVLVIGIVEAKISINRLWEFLTFSELDDDPPARIGQVGIKITDGNFSWDNKPTLKNINFEVNEGELVMIVGPVGSGKSSLISAVLGSIQKMNGTIERSGTIAYAAQQAWIMNQTLKENILFSKPYDEAKYRSTIHAACLKQDLAMLPGGDGTEIGEKGINLSGGQKQRVALARAIYSDADIYILDDVLSAVDSHVGKHIFEECIMGVLSNKTRFFATHQNQFLPFADKIIVLKDGEIIHMGSYTDLIRQGVDFSALVSKPATGENKNQGDVEEDEDEDEDEEVQDAIDEQVERVEFTEKDSLIANDLKGKQKLSSKKQSRQSTDPNLAKPKQGKLTEAEERESGVVDGKVYWKYITASGGYLFLLSMLMSYVIAELARVGGDIWLSLWSTPEEERRYSFNPPPFGSDTEEFFLFIYLILGAGYAILSLVRNMFTAVAGVNASRSLHEGLFGKIMKAPVNFFDITPVGRILNRFTKDLDNVDNLLPQTINQFLGTLAICISTLVLIAYITPLFLAALVPILLFYFFVMQFYRKSSRELQRLDSISRSPIYNHFSESIIGTDTIKAFGMTRKFCGENETRINYNQRAYWMVQITNRWLSLRLEVLGTLITFSSAIFAVVARDTINPALAGLSITYALQVTGFLNWVVRMATQGEAQMNAVERIQFYSQTESEASWIVPNNRPGSKWPQKPEIIMRNVFMRYRVGLEPVLKGISLVINPGEKIGVVGRTGAGKSSLMLVLFRMVEAYQGEIIIDGVDISKIGLHDLRSRLSIIPQDPVLFSGTVRSNLDPFNDHEDTEIWRVLEQVHLKREVQLSGGLESQVAENGSNWSLGQRQLFCFGRALLKKTKILVMDEATSSVDVETDSLIQKMIRTEFADRTILTIAHRLTTIMDSDRVIVMDAGKVAEFDTPAKLLESSKGIFSSMVQNTGPKNATLLRKIANREADIFGAPMKSQGLPSEAQDLQSS